MIQHKRGGLALDNDANFPPRLLTLEILRKRGACEAGQHAFLMACVKGKKEALVNFAWATHASQWVKKSDWNWCSRNLLPTCALLVYDDLLYGSEFYSQECRRQGFSSVIPLFEDRKVRIARQAIAGRIFAALYMRTDERGWL